MRVIGNYIQGEIQPPLSGTYLDDVDPATGQVYAQTPASEPRDLELAVAAARAALPGWAETPAAERSRLLLAIADRLEQHLEAFALAECIDTGKPLRLARALDVPRAIANFRFFATAILHERSDAFVTDHAAVNYTLRRPRGVCGLIAPWNLPLYLLSWKIAPALATGNTAVAKPSEITPMTAHLLAQVCVEAGLPAGVLNIVHGTGPVVGQALAEHPAVRTISFTGSTATGARIAAAGAGHFKKLALEMGGKNPSVVFADADPGVVLPEVVRAAFTNQGQICLCGSRVLIERRAYRDFVEALVWAAGELTPGDPLEEPTQQGALVSQAHLEKVDRCVQQARDDGGEVLCGGAPAAPPNARCAGGFFYPPTVIAGLGPAARANQEEIFGPVVTVLPFDDEAEAAQLANATDYGLAASVWTRDLARAQRLAERIEAGTVWVNCWMLRDLRAPFGGMKNSGLGREGGEEALRFFTEPKNVCLKS